ncbi:MAG: dihydrolipoyl dehydrogenase [Clostridiales Family XIII bacterium]|jgi:dihydrolipoamide dehydrogenase|nr:dihydrolipoyl dehydrogenase [Clostridiales Family XIII bacterium]
MKKITIIGGGPGGYVAAIRAAQLGAEVQIVESGSFGGTCLNIGCIPTKALLHSAFAYKHLIEGSIAGVRAEKVTLDWAAAQAHKKAVTDKLVGGVSGLLAANKVTVTKGTAVFAGSKTITVDGKALPKSDAIILASGSVPVKLNFPGADLPQVIDSTGALALEKLPASLAIIGGGVIGVEFASLFSALGVKVTIIEALPEILPPIDGQIAALLRGVLAKNRVDILTAAKVVAVKKDGKNAVSEIEHGGEKKQIKSELVLLAVGRRPNTTELGLEKAGIQTERGAILTDEHFETNVKGIFAIGDCNAKNMLAHAASAQGEAAVEYILSGAGHYDANIIPACIYTEPEVAAVGLTEEEAKKKQSDYAVGTFDLAGNGKALIDGGLGGLIKILAERQTGEILGVHMMGPHVTDMIAEAAAVMEMEGLTEDLLRTVHPHPTVSEAVHEAAQAVFGNAVHWPPRR